VHNDLLQMKVGLFSLKRGKRDLPAEMLENVTGDVMGCSTLGSFVRRRISNTLIWVSFDLNVGLF